MKMHSILSSAVFGALLFTVLIPSTDAVTFNVSHINEEDYLLVDEGQVLPMNITIFDGVQSGKFSVRSTDEFIFEVVNSTENELLSSDELPFTFTVHVHGKFVGIKDIELVLTNSSDVTPVTIGMYPVKVLRVPTILDALFTYLILAWLVLSYVTMGAKMQPKIIWSKMKPPWGILIGMLGQFFLMPLWAFALTKIFALDSETALGLTFVGTCPGGWLSNIFSLLLDCDFVLSLTMTFFSTVLALGMMPLNLFIYASAIVSDNSQLQTPFTDLAIQLILLIIPVGIGMGLCYKFIKFRKICEKLLKPFAGVLIVLALGLGIPSQLYIFQSPWQVWVVAALLPVGGVIAGALIAKIACLPKKSVITVALETGAQNSLLAKTMLDLFYPRPESDLVGRVALMISLISLLEGTVATLGYVGIRYVCCPKKEDEDDLVEQDDKNEKKVDAEKGAGAKGDTKKEESSQTKFPDDEPADQTHVNPVFDDNEATTHDL